MSEPLRRTRLSRDELTGRKGEIFGYNLDSIARKLRTSSMPFLYDVAKGDVPGSFSMHQTGYNDSVGSSLETIWTGGGLYPYLSAGEVLKVVSDNAADSGDELASGTATSGSTTTLVDTGADFVTGSGVAAGDLVLDDTNLEYGFVSVVTATEITLVTAKKTAFASGTAYRVVNADSTGAAVIKVEGCDDSYDLLTNFVVMNGTSDVGTVGEFLRVWKLTAIHAGSTGSNVGVIAIEDNASAVVMGQIRATRNVSEMALFTVPDGYTAYIVETHVAELANKRVSVTKFTRQPGGLFIPIGETIAAIAGSDSHQDLQPLVVPERYDIELRGASVTTGAAVYGSFELWYESNGV